jgi:4-aminobutyrate aminotransferase
LANIRYTEQNNLCTKAREDGEYNRERLNAMRQDFSILGEVRGAGLMIGIELISDKHPTPAAASAEAVQASCLERGLFGWGRGIYGNVVRIQPPLTINRQQIDFALGVLRECLQLVNEQAPAEIIPSGAELIAEHARWQADI